MGTELDGEKLWRDQVLGTRLGETSGRKWKKTSFFLGIQTPRLAPKSEDSRLVWGQNRWGKAVAGPRGGEGSKKIDRDQKKLFEEIILKII